MIMMTIMIYALTLNIDKKERKELCMKEAVLQNVTSDLVTVVTF